MDTQFCIAGRQERPVLFPGACQQCLQQQLAWPLRLPQPPQLATRQQPPLQQTPRGPHRGRRGGLPVAIALQRQNRVARDRSVQVVGRLAGSPAALDCHRRLAARRRRCHAPHVRPRLGWLAGPQLTFSAECSISTVISPAGGLRASRRGTQALEWASPCGPLRALSPVHWHWRPITMFQGRTGSSARGPQATHRLLGAQPAEIAP